MKIVELTEFQIFALKTLLENSIKNIEKDKSKRLTADSYRKILQFKIDEFNEILEIISA